MVFCVYVFLCRFRFVFSLGWFCLLLICLVVGTFCFCVLV